MPFLKPEWMDNGTYKMECDILSRIESCTLKYILSGNKATVFTIDLLALGYKFDNGPIGTIALSTECTNAIIEWREQEIVKILSFDSKDSLSPSRQRLSSATSTQATLSPRDPFFPISPEELKKYPSLGRMTSLKLDPVIENPPVTNKHQDRLGQERRTSSKSSDGQKTPSNSSNSAAPNNHPYFNGEQSLFSRMLRKRNLFKFITGRGTSSNTTGDNSSNSSPTDSTGSSKGGGCVIN